MRVSKFGHLPEGSKVIIAFAQQEGGKMVNKQFFNATVSTNVPDSGYLWLQVTDPDFKKLRIGYLEGLGISKATGIERRARFTTGFFRISQ